MPKKEVMLRGTGKVWFNEKVLNAIKQRINRRSNRLGGLQVEM